MGVEINGNMRGARVLDGFGPPGGLKSYVLCLVVL
jgi:hypothetical protein